MKYTSTKNSKTYTLAQLVGKQLRFFTLALKDGQVEIDLPAGHTVVESEATGLPLLKKSAA